MPSSLVLFLALLVKYGTTVVVAALGVCSLVAHVNVVPDTILVNNQYDFKIYMPGVI